MRLFALMLGVVLVASSCADDRITLERGPLGPAAYNIHLDVTGASAVQTEGTSARLEVEEIAGGAILSLSVEGDDPILAELERGPDGRLSLETIGGVSPRSAGEADLASLVGQLDPPLATEPVRIGESWSSERTFTTGSLEARLQTTLRVAGFRRIAGTDAAELSGRVEGRLRAEGPAGTFEGTVSGETTIAWGLETGRLAASRTRLVWTIPGTGDVELDARVEPAQG